jgi:hypothetical protein
MLTAFPDLSVTLSWNGREATLLGRELQPHLRQELLRLLGLGAHDIHSAASMGGGRGRENGTENGIDISRGSERDSGIETERPFSGTLPGSCDEGRRGEGAAGVDNAVEQVARVLALSLADLKSLDWYRQVARTVPLGVIRAALGAALELPRREVRRSRGSYFTAIVRPHLAKSRATHQA